MIRKFKQWLLKSNIGLLREKPERSQQDDETLARMEKYARYYRWKE